MNLKKALFLALGLSTTLWAAQASAMSVKIYNNVSNPLAGLSGEYRAAPSADLLGIVSSYYVPGVTIATDASKQTWFGTFCLETTEEIDPNVWANVALSYKAELGGYIAPHVLATSGDPLSVGSAYLYENFALGTLHSLVPSFNYGDVSSSGALQSIIYSLEDEKWWIDPSTNIFYSTLLAKFGTWDAAKADVTPGNNFGVMVMNESITNRDGVTTLLQDHMVFVPDGAWTVGLLGAAMLGLSLLRRKLRA